VYADANPALTSTITGLVNGDTAAVVSVSAAVSTAATASSAVGTYAITVGAGTLSAANYDFANLVGGVLTVTKAHLTVTADAKSKAYGVANPPLTATITGFKNGDTATVVSGSPSLTTTVTTSSLPGTYPIVVGIGALAAANYDFP